MDYNRALNAFIPNKIKAKRESNTIEKNSDMSSNKKREIAEKVAEWIFFLCAFVAVISVVAITVFVFYRGLQPFLPWKEDAYSFWEFITGTQWRPSDNPEMAKYGISFMIVGSLLATGGAILIGVPIGILTAVFIAEIAPAPLVKIIKPAVELLAGIPSVIYGVFGLGVLVPAIMNISPNAAGQSLLAVIIVLTIMILPTVITIAEASIRAVPKTYREGSLALGVSKIETIFKVVLPAAKSGILAGVVLGIGRAIGETMAVMLVAGNPAEGLPSSIWDPIRPLTTNIAMEMSYAAGSHRDMLFATGVVLFTFIIILNVILNRINAKAGDR